MIDNIQSMVAIAIANAKFHDIQLHHARPNNANGDCAFEAVEDNINLRPCFKDKIRGSPEYIRRKWLDETENLVFLFCGGGGLSRVDFKEEWEKLKQPRAYEYDFADYVLPAIAHCTKKDILIFNTKPDGPFDPIFVVEASKLGGQAANTDIPVLLAYNNAHFESLIPDSDLDQIKTIDLKNLYLSNNYTTKKEDIPIFVELMILLDEAKVKHKGKECLNIKSAQFSNSDVCSALGNQSSYADVLKLSKRRKHIVKEQYQDNSSVAKRPSISSIVKRQALSNEHYFTLSNENKSHIVSEQNSDSEICSNLGNKSSYADIVKFGKTGKNIAKDLSQVNACIPKRPSSSSRRSLNREQKLISSNEDKILDSEIERIRAIKKKDRTIDEQREFCKLLMRKKRKNQSLEERMEYNDECRVRMKNHREKESDRKKIITKDKQKERMKNLRENKSDQEKLEYNVKSKERMKHLRKEESDQKKLDTNVKQKNYIRNAREKLSDGDKIEHNVKSKNLMKRLREEESDQKKEDRNIKQKNYIKNVREKLSNSEKIECNVKSKDRMKRLREKLSDSEKDIYNVKSKERMKHLREEASDQKKEDTKIKQKNYIKNVRDRETEIQRKESNDASKERMRTKRATYDEKDKGSIRMQDSLRKASVKRKSLSERNEIDRIKAFKEDVRYGPIFICSTCEQTLFKKAVVQVDEGLLQNIEIAFAKKKKESFDQVIGSKLLAENLVEVCIQGQPDMSSHYICRTCKKYLVKGEMPPMSVENGLKTISVPDDLKLSELENNLIAKVIPFQKVFKLPTSRMAAVKDKIVNIPIHERHIITTFQSLPKTPMEGGLIEVKLKRKQEYKNAHSQAFISPGRLFSALNYLKRMGNPHYQFFENVQEYEAKCKRTDPEGYALLFADAEEPTVKKQPGKIVYIYVNDENTPLIREKKEYLTDLEEEWSLIEDKYYKQNDAIRKYQIDYDDSVCLTEKFPEALSSEVAQLSLAPGEGCVPQNILTYDNWDALAFPMKHPTGKYNLHYKRKKKLSDQYYFVQRLRNKNKQYSRDTSYLFSAAQYLEKKQFQRNINVSYMRGTKSSTGDGAASYKLEDGFNVFDNTSNTPKYWQVAKYEMIAKLNNLGPFAFFFTLSSADLRWNENFTTLLIEKGIKIVYEIDGLEENVWVLKDDNEKKLLKDYIEQEEDESFHEMVRRNVIIATRNYKNRFDAFIKNIIMDKSNPMCITHWRI